MKDLRTEVMIREAVLFCLGVAMWAEDDEGDDGIVSGCGSGTAGGRAGGVEDVRLWTVEEFLVAMGVVGCVPELVIAVVSSSQSSSQYKLSGDIAMSAGTLRSVFLGINKHVQGVTDLKYIGSIRNYFENHGGCATPSSITSSMLIDELIKPTQSRRTTNHS